MLRWWFTCAHFELHIRDMLAADKTLTCDPDEVHAILKTAGVYWHHAMKTLPPDAGRTLKHTTGGWELALKIPTIDDDGNIVLELDWDYDRKDEDDLLEMLTPEDDSCAAFMLGSSA